MALTLYLAMTAAEMQTCPPFPAYPAWMACHFSPYSNGISNIPCLLPDGAMLILNDRIPPQGHDPQLVAQQLAQVADDLQISRVLLDFQRPNCMQTAAIARAVVCSLPCAVGITPAYAEGLACPVFLPIQLRKLLQEQLAPWQGREVWLDAATECEVITVTTAGSQIVSGTIPVGVSTCHTDTQLHCQYFLELEDDCARFTVWRDQAQLQALLDEAETLGIEQAIGLYQQLYDKTAENL